MPIGFRFGDYQIDAAEHALYRGAERLAINRRTFQVLRLLVERSGEIVTKQEFFDSVWGDTFVEDNSLTVAMTTLRKVLGEDAKNPRFIENLPRKGYRFIADVSVVHETLPLPATVANRIVEKPASAIAFYDRRTFVGGLAVCLLFLLFVAGFRYFRSSDSGATASTLFQGASRIDSIAVLPLQRLNPDLEYVADGLTEGIISNLAVLPSLRVINRNSAFQYKQPNMDSTLEAVGRQLNVRAVLTGRVVQNGDSIQVSVELTDVRDKRQIWGQRYERNIDNLFDVQQEISMSIANGLRESLSEREKQRIAAHQTDSPDAYRLYLKGRYYLERRTADDYVKALDLFNQAIRQDPTFALAYVGQASCYAFGTMAYLDRPDTRNAMITASVNRALEIDKDLADGYGVLGLTKAYYQWDWAGAEQAYRRALDLDPNYASAHHWYAEFLAIHGRFEESFAEYEKARANDPLSMAINVDLGMAYYYAGQSDRAIEFLNKIKSVDPRFSRTYSNLSMIYRQKGMISESIAESETYFNILEDKPALKKLEAVKKAYQESGEKGYWSKSLEVFFGDLNFSYQSTALVHLKLNDPQLALDWLEKDFASHDPISVYINVMPEFEPLHSHPRFIEIVRNIGLQ